jgi:hypothetical protein
MSLPGDPLLPNLRELRWNSWDEDTFIFIRLFLGPHITRLNVRMQREDMFTRLSLLRTLTARYPSLEHLHLSYDEMWKPDSDHLNAVSRVISGWSQLRRLAVGPLSQDGLYHVATLPALEELELRKAIAHVSLPFSWSSTIRFFPCLKDLFVTCDQLSFACALVKTMSSSPLLSINIASDDALDSHRQELIDALPNACSHSSLRFISIEEGEGEIEFDTLIDIKPLFVFSSLTSVTLSIRAALDLDDASIKNMAKAWPHITSLVLKEDRDIDPRITLSGLVSLAQYCPELQRLSIPLDARSVPHQSAESFGMTHSALANLSVARMLVTERKPVALFLHALFPRAKVAADLGQAFFPEWLVVYDDA